MIDCLLTISGIDVQELLSFGTSKEGLKEMIRLIEIFGSEWRIYCFPYSQDPGRYATGKYTSSKRIFILKVEDDKNGGD